MANPLCRGFPEELDLAQFEKKCENLKKKKIHPPKKERDKAISVIFYTATKHEIRIPCRAMVKSNVSLQTLNRCVEGVQKTSMLLPPSLSQPKISCRVTHVINTVIF